MAFDIDATVQSQYAASPHIRALIAAFWAAINPEADIKLIYEKMVDIDTAEGFGLDVWGRIVALARDYIADTSNVYWGFPPPAGITNLRVRNYENAPFYAPVSGAVKQSDDAYRQYIKLKAKINIGNGSLASLNELIADLWPGVNVKLIHSGTMSLRLVIQEEVPAADLQALLTLPWLPAGVELEIYQVITPTWGLEGSNLETLDNGTFSLSDIDTFTS